MTDAMVAKALSGIVAASLAGGVALALNGGFGGQPWAMVSALLVAVVMASEFGLILGGIAKDMTTMFAIWKSAGILVFAPAVFFLFPGLPQWIARLFPSYNFLGPIIGIVSASIVALATGGGFGMVGHVLIVFALIQLIDNILVQPVVLAKSVDLHPLIVLFVVLVGGQLMGLKGMLIAVPMTGIIKVSTQTILEGVRRYRIQ